MKVTTIPSREFNQDIGSAKRAAADGPVIITDRGHPAHVLLTMEAYEAMLSQKENIVSRLAMSDALDTEFEVPRLKDGFFKAEDFSDD